MIPLCYVVFERTKAIFLSYKSLCNWRTLVSDHRLLLPGLPHYIVRPLRSVEFWKNKECFGDSWPTKLALVIVTCSALFSRHSHAYLLLVELYLRTGNMFWLSTLDHEARSIPNNCLSLHNLASVSTIWICKFRHAASTGEIAPSSHYSVWWERQFVCIFYPWWVLCTNSYKHSNILLLKNIAHFAK